MNFLKSYTTKRKLIFFTFICSIFHIACSQSNSLTPGNETAASDTITVDINEPIHSIHPAFWGTNFLFWVDDDAALADGTVMDRLRAANITLLRYPGGTVADNFHWATNTLDNINMYPFEDGESQTDFDEFMQVCRQVGAEPSVVVNTESWVVKDSIAAGAHEAANWLRYSKERGYDVNYWEIGNETYWHPVMSAEEYAEVVNTYADSLKRIDPDIIIGANGHWDIDFVGTKERLKEGTYSQVMDYRRNINSQEDHKAYKEFYKENRKYPYTNGSPKWWQTVAEDAGHNVDMIVVHQYFSPDRLAAMSKKLSEVRNLFSEMYPDKSFLFNMSEYNIHKRNAFNNNEHVYLTEAVGEMLRGGVDITGFWPMRLKSHYKPMLIDYETHEPSILYKIHQRLSNTLQGSLVQSRSSDKIPSYASYADTSSTVVMTGRNIDVATEVAIEVKGDQQGFDSASIWRIRGDEFDYQIEEENIEAKQGKATIELRPSEIAIVTFKQKMEI